jgi:hypothetical protein
MGKGAGALPREILETLEEAKGGQLDYHGSESRAWHPAPAFRLPGWVWHRGNCVRLADGVYDLRASVRYLAERHGKRGPHDTDRGFQARFSRAAHGLVRRGELVALSLVPLAGWDPDACSLVVCLAGGDYLSVHGRQVRFVGRPRAAGGQ